MFAILMDSGEKKDQNPERSEMSVFSLDVPLLTGRKKKRRAGRPNRFPALRRAEREERAVSRACRHRVDKERRILGGWRTNM